VPKALRDHRGHRAVKFSRDGSTGTTLTLEHDFEYTPTPTVLVSTVAIAYHTCEGLHQQLRLLQQLGSIDSRPLSP
jgi:hypothetical protein